jgi:hypothetical protein
MSFSMPMTSKQSSAKWRPIGALEERRAIRDVDADVAGPRRLDRLDPNVTTRDLPTQPGRLGQGQAVRPKRSPREILEDTFAWIHQNAALVRSTLTWPVTGSGGLIGSESVPRTGDDTAAIDHGAQAVGVGVLGEQELGGELGRPVQRPSSVERKRLVDS